MTITIKNLKFKKQTNIVSNVKYFQIVTINRTKWLIINQKEPYYEFDTIRMTTNELKGENSIDIGGKEINVSI